MTFTILHDKFNNISATVEINSISSSVKNAAIKLFNFLHATP